MNKYSKCRCCDADNLSKWLELPDSPVANALYSKPNLNKYKLSLVYCNNCGHLQLEEAPDPDSVFLEYRYRSGVSKSFATHFTNYANEVYKKIDKKHPRILEVGSNDGFLLQKFKELGAEVTGVEPSEFLKEDHQSKNISVVSTFFTKELVKKQAWENYYDVICANNVLAHIPDIKDVIDGISLALRPGGLLVAECGNQQAIVSGKYLDNVYHEHIDYYSPHSFGYLLSRYNLFVEYCESINTHGKSFRIYARKNLPAGFLPKDTVNFKEYAIEVKNKIAQRKQTINNILMGRKFVAYGAAAKAVTSLYTLELINDMVGVVDDNDLKQNCYFPGTDIKISSPENLDKNALVLVTAWNVFEDIKEKLISRGHTGEIICMP